MEFNACAPDEKLHSWIFLEELGNDDQNDIVCWLCRESISGPAYKCSECKFLLHKSCTKRHHTSSAKLSHVIQHPLHPEHNLTLCMPLGSNDCDVCSNSCMGSHFYRCSPCNFDIDVKCVSRWGISVDDCHQHELFPTRKKIQFTCEACGEESKGIAHQCSVCRLMIHRDCRRFPHTIKPRTHEHSLYRTYAIGQVKMLDDIKCEVCGTKVNTEYAAYFCQRCDFIAHLSCVSYSEVEDEDV